jgi:hypothetical protein
MVSVFTYVTGGYTFVHTHFKWSLAPGRTHYHVTVLHMVLFANGAYLCGRRIWIFKWLHNHMHDICRFAIGFKKSTLFVFARGHMDPYVHGFWRLGARRVLTILQFTPFFGYAAGARF